MLHSTSSLDTFTSQTSPTQRHSRNSHHISIISDLISFIPLPIFHPPLSLASIISCCHLKGSSTMAMILQCIGSDDRILPYFIIGPHPQVDSVLRTSACLTSDYHYPCSYHCIGLSMPWNGGTATAVAPMILLDTVRLLAEDVRTHSTALLAGWF